MWIEAYVQIFEKILCTPHRHSPYLYVLHAKMCSIRSQSEKTNKQNV